MVLLRDTKNRSEHKLLLSRRAQEIATKHCSGKKPDDVLFPIVDARKTLAWINVQAKTNVQGHGLRAIFASIAEELVSGAVLKRMLNHAAGADVTLGQYVGKSEGQLPAGMDPDACRQHLARQQIHVAVRGSAVRVSPHVYNDEHDLEQLSNALAQPAHGGNVKRPKHGN